MSFRVEVEDLRLFEGVLEAEGISTSLAEARDYRFESLVLMNKIGQVKQRPNPLPDEEYIKSPIAQLMGINPQDEVDLAAQASDEYAANDLKMPGVHKMPTPSRADKYKRKTVMGEKIHANLANRIAALRRKSLTAP